MTIFISQQYSNDHNVGGGGVGVGGGGVGSGGGGNDHH